MAQDYYPDDFILIELDRFWLKHGCSVGDAHVGCGGVYDFPQIHTGAGASAKMVRESCECMGVVF